MVTLIRLYRSSALLFAGAALAGLAAADSIYPVGNLGTDSDGFAHVELKFAHSGTAYGVSDVYTNFHNFRGTRGFVWDATNGIRSIGSTGFDGTTGSSYSTVEAMDTTGRIYGSMQRYVGGVFKGYRAISYTPSGGIVQLGNLGTDASGYGQSAAVATDNAGRAFGNSTLYSGGVSKGSRAFVWSQATGIQNVGDLGLDATGFGASYMFGSNAPGHAFGRYNDYSSGSFKGARGFVWDTVNGSQAIGTLGTDATGFSFSSVSVYDAAGQAYGDSNLYVGGVSKGSRAVRWDAVNGLRSLGDLGVDATGMGGGSVNYQSAAGRVFGTYMKYDGGQEKARYAFTYDAGGMRDLGNLGVNAQGYGETRVDIVDAHNRAYGISQKFVGGQSKGFHAFRWDNTNGLQDLGVLGTDANGNGGSSVGAVDGFGRVYGSATDFIGGQLAPRAFVWTATSGMTYLGNLVDPAVLSNWTLVSVKTVTDDGWVYGMGYRGTGNKEWYALHLPAQAVPEPATLAAMVIGGGALLRRRKRA
ncbi:PEP-CTERM sorting domain-containing protein [bacterium]|nr:MAG: PEP-CTERM sorting domain-containing protein [bacterium]